MMPTMYRILVCLVVSVFGLSACGGSSSGGGCDFAEGCINRGALMNDTPAERLSAYNLFQNPEDPTDNPRENGQRYELTSSLFSDYSSKYRFVFVPPGQSAQWDDAEAFDFPVGTVITKTFSMPADTAHPGFDNERLLETRLLIRRSNGWHAYPYVWNEEGTEAILRPTGANISLSVVHNGEQRDFVYRVPERNHCVRCHQKTVGNTAAMVLIGPKARFLNRDEDFGEGPVNQLRLWADAGLLSGVPDDLSMVETVPAFNHEDAALIDGMSDAYLHQMAKGYLDINCAHCHRPEGSARNSGMSLEFWRDFETNRTRHGVCKRPVAFTASPFSFGIVPGDAEESLMYYRMSTTQPGHRMPELGKGTVHDEGLALIGAWIDRMPPDNCEGS